ncbi:hypothetical protein MBLNU459_g8213t1 [Dothideomycetes sp. NU459]
MSAWDLPAAHHQIPAKGAISSSFDWRSQTMAPNLSSTQPIAPQSEFMDVMNPSQLLYRIAVLETELKQKQDEAATVQQVNRYLLQQLAKSETNEGSPEIKFTNELDRTALENPAMGQKMRHKRKLRAFAPNFTTTETAVLNPEGSSGGVHNDSCLHSGHTAASPLDETLSLSPFAPAFTPSDPFYSAASVSFWEPITPRITHISAGRASPNGVRDPTLHNPASAAPMRVKNTQGESSQTLVHTSPPGDLGRSIWARPIRGLSPRTTRQLPTSRFESRHNTEPDLVSSGSDAANLGRPGPTSLATGIVLSSEMTLLGNQVDKFTIGSSGSKGILEDEDLLGFPEEVSSHSTGADDKRYSVAHSTRRISSGTAIQSTFEPISRPIQAPIMGRQYLSPSAQLLHRGSGRGIGSGFRDSKTGLLLRPDQDVQHTRSLLMYQPKSNESGFYRTVLVTNVPPTVPVTTIMSCVRGGVVISVQPMNSLPITGYNTLMIVFLKEESARAFVDYANTYALCSDVGKKQIILGVGSIHRTTFSLLHSPTWPLSRHVKQKIDFGEQSRCLVIYGLEHEITIQALCNVLAEAGTKQHAILSASRDFEGTVHLEFASIAGAERAKERSDEHPWFRETKVEYADDPCGRPLPAYFAGAGCGLPSGDYEQRPDTVQKLNGHGSIG